MDRFHPSPGPGKYLAQTHSLLGIMAFPCLATVLPNGEFPDLHLSHPTPSESLEILKSNAHEWKGPLSLAEYLEEADYLATVSSVQEIAMTEWILVARNLAPDNRPILSSCETFRKRALISDRAGAVEEVIIHTVASVFCSPELRGMGFGKKMMRELALKLKDWKTGDRKCIGSVLYSDIGKNYYAKFGWLPFPGINSHLVFPATKAQVIEGATKLLSSDLEQLCREDEEMIHSSMARVLLTGKTRMMILPDHASMIWHHSREDFECKKLFGAIPTTKGAMAGEQGDRVWIIWTHQYHGRPDHTDPGNTLYILRLVVENQESLKTSSDKNRTQIQASFEAVIHAAQAEAFEWKLHNIKLLDPSPSVQGLAESAGIEHQRVERQEEEIGSLLWYGEGTGKEDELDWISNEKFAWC